MDKNAIRQNGLLEQYLLGLTTREESAAVEAYLAADPEARKDLEHLRTQLGVFINEQEFGEKAVSGASAPVIYADQEAVITHLNARVQRLSAIRYLLAAACALLFLSTAYFFRQSRLSHSALISEKARHVQDDRLHEREIVELSRETVHLDSLQTVVSASTSGNLLLHYLTTDSVVLLDLSHLEPLAEGFAYHVHLVREDKEIARHEIGAHETHSLYPLDRSGAKLKVIRGPDSTGMLAGKARPQVIAELDLSAASALK